MIRMKKKKKMMMMLLLIAVCSERYSLLQSSVVPFLNLSKLTVYPTACADF